MTSQPNRSVQTTEDDLFFDAVFRLGQIGSSARLTNARLLRKIARTLVRHTEVAVGGIAVHEQGVEAPANAVHVCGPWTDEQATQFMAWSSWLDPRADGTGRQGLSEAQRNQVYTTVEFLGESDAEPGTVPTFTDQPQIRLADLAFGIYRRQGGAEAYVGIASVDGGEPISKTAMDRFTRIAPFAAKAWAAGWACEPAWVGELKPNCLAVLSYVLEGLDDDQIAVKTGLSYHSVRAHLKRLFRVADVRSRLHLMQAYRQESSGRISGKQVYSPQSGTGEETDSVMTVVDPSDTAFGVSFQTAS